MYVFLMNEIPVNNNSRYYKAFKTLAAEFSSVSDGYPSKYKKIANCKRENIKELEPRLCSSF